MGKGTRRVDFSFPVRLALGVFQRTLSHTLQTRARLPEHAPVLVTTIEGTRSSDTAPCLHIPKQGRRHLLLRYEVPPHPLRTLPGHAGAGMKGKG